MSVRQFPVSPDVHHVKREAKYLLRAFRSGDPQALADFREFFAKAISTKNAKLSDAQLVLARSYGATSFPQLIAAVDFIRACWSNDGSRVRDAVLAHADILSDYYKTPHDGWREDLSAAARQGTGTALKFMRETSALIADAEQRQAHVREWAAVIPVLHKLGDPFARPTVPAPDSHEPRGLADVQEEFQNIVKRLDSALQPEDEARQSRLEQHMKEHAQDPTKINRRFERMRAHNLQFPTEPSPSLGLKRRRELMNECLRLYIESHPLP